ncbi:hypothetical protein [Sulfuricurvum sp.]|uniref:hypothetical protein n=1 Tax=Sulfuricurvum sp. TaxID=2025608 RepID=UPI00286E83CA|nr:hypothetical protein [Sulfuricurvum sp.]
MDKASIGLFGVVLGAGLTVGLTVLKEWWFQREKNQKEVEFLSIHMVCLLEKFIDGCIDVISDDGYYQGQRESDGCLHPQVSLPIFEPQSLKVEWKALPSNLMYDILNFPNEIEIANRLISNEFEFSAFPPDYDEGFEERQYQYALLGLKAFELAQKLRNLAKLPKYESRGFDPIKIMNDEKDKTEKLRQRRAEEHAALMKKIETDKA